MRAQDARRRRYVRRPLPPPSEDEMRWRRFLAELPDRIAAIRAEAPTTCETCGSTTPEVIERKTCTNCLRELPVVLFARNRTNKDGRQFWCKACQRPLNARLAKARRSRLAQLEASA